MPMPPVMPAPPIPPVTPPTEPALYMIGTHVTVRPGMNWFRSSMQAERGAGPVLATPGNYIVTAVAPNGAINVGKTPEQQLGWLYAPLYCDMLLTSSFYRVGDSVTIGRDIRWYVTAEGARTRTGPSSPAMPGSYMVNKVFHTGMLAVGRSPAVTLGWVNPLDIHVGV